jgi:hypothetical protein
MPVALSVNRMMAEGQLTIGCRLSWSMNMATLNLPAPWCSAVRISDDPWPLYGGYFLNRYGRSQGPRYARKRVIGRQWTCPSYLFEQSSLCRSGGRVMGLGNLAWFSSRDLGSRKLQAQFHGAGQDGDNRRLDRFSRGTAAASDSVETLGLRAALVLVLSLVILAGFIAQAAQPPLEPLEGQ